MGDLRYAWRGLSRNLGFTIVAAFSLALGIGATTALFSVVYGVLISPYPYKDPGTIWSPHTQSPKDEDRWTVYSFDDFQRLAKLPAFSDAMATAPVGEMLLTGDFAPQTFRGVRVTGNAFQFLGVPPVIGRTIQPTDFLNTGEAADVVVLSFKMWQKLFGGDRAAIGKTLRLNDRVYQVIGVMPPRFGWWTGDGFWMPFGREGESERRVCVPIMRLKNDVTAVAAQTQLQALDDAIAKEIPDRYPKEGFRSRLVNYLDMTVASGEMQRTLWLLFGAVVLLLLIACANVANLQLARSSARVREMAIRLSVGADQRRLLRQLLTESVLLSLIGGALGLLFAFWITRLMVHLMPDFYVPNEARVELNGYVLLFSVAVSMLTGIVFGLAPALQSSKVDLTQGLKDAGKGSGESMHGGITRKTLVVVEVALSVMLLLSAGLTIRTFVALQQVNLGFQVENVTTMRVPLPPKRYDTLERRNRFAQELLERVERIPGVEAAAIGNGGMPFDGAETEFQVTGRAKDESQRMILFLSSANYLSTMRVPLIRGRNFTEREVADGERLALINQTAAKLWGGDDPIGKSISLSLLTNASGALLKPADGSSVVTVIGIVGDTKNDGLRNQPRGMAMTPFTLVAPPNRALAVRSRGNSDALVNAIRAQLAEIDKLQPLDRPTTAAKMLEFETVQPRFTMALFGVFAAIGLALAAAGIYSVLSFLVTRRRHEIGVRMALGAQWGDILRLVLSTGAKLIASGLVVGLFGGFVVMRLLNAQLFGVTSGDPISYGAVVAVLAVVGFLASYIPARRAARVNPTEALRYE